MVRYSDWENESVASFNDNARKHLNDFSRQYTFKRKSIDLSSRLAPPTVQELNKFLTGDKCLQWVTDVSGRNCDTFKGRAVLYGLGDFIANHNDLYIHTTNDGKVITRSVTFNYYLTKYWRKGWGGEFIWNNPRTVIIPTFNTLVMFLVGPESSHSVAPVSLAAMEPRLAITG